MSATRILLPPALAAISALDNAPHMTARCDACTQHVAGTIRADRSTLLSILTSMTPGCGCATCAFLRQHAGSLVEGKRCA